MKLCNEAYVMILVSDWFHCRCKSIKHKNQHFRLLSFDKLQLSPFLKETKLEFTFYAIFSKRNPLTHSLKHAHIHTIM